MAKEGDEEVVAEVEVNHPRVVSGAARGRAVSGVEIQEEGLPGVVTREGVVLEAVTQEVEGGGDQINKEDRKENGLVVRGVGERKGDDKRNYFGVGECYARALLDLI